MQPLQCKNTATPYYLIVTSRLHDSDVELNDETGNNRSGYQLMRLYGKHEFFSMGTVVLAQVEACGSKQGSCDPSIAMSCSSYAALL